MIASPVEPLIPEAQEAIAVVLAEIQHSGDDPLARIIHRGGNK
jgi:hypothetical protein